MRTKQGRTDVSDELLMKVFLVLQEMKASGADPDIACYNAILRACARAGDISKLRDVLRRIELDGLVPNATTWKETIRGASIARDSTMAERMWKMALAQEDDNLEGSYSDEKWTPGIEEFDLLITSYIREAAKAPEKMECLYSKVLDAYIGVANGEERFGLHHIDLDDVKNKPRTVKMISQATAFLRSTCTDADGQHLPVLESNIRQAEIDFGLAP
jgi:pentatricopeptide repeat protein